MPDLHARRLLRAWLPLLVWTAIVWQLGGDRFSAAQTSRILGPLINWLLPNFSPEDRQFWVWLIRLSAHPAVYGVQGLLTWRAVRIQWPTSPPGAWAAIVLLGGAALAGADEIRQSASLVRQGSATGVILDLLGTLVVIAAIAALERWRRQRLAPPRPGE